ncbi:MAG: TetR/AcrR family transcriptional regulator [Aeromicrobium sp.]
MTTSERSYAGADATTRRRDRRDRLVLAGLELIGTHGYDSTTVHGIAAAAGVGDRYFYEHFTDRMDFFKAVYDVVIEQVQRASVAAYVQAGADLESQVRAGLTAFVHTLTDDPRLARIQLVESVGRGGALERRRAEVMQAYAGLLETQARELLAGRVPSDAELTMGTRALVGATNQLVMDYANDDLAVTRDQLIDHLVQLYLDVTHPRRG